MTTEVKKLVFGPHYAEDGKTWVGDPLGSGVELILNADGAVYVSIGCRWEMYSYLLSPEERATLIEWLTSL